MEIDIKNIKAAYETATESEKTLLATLFPDMSLGQTEEKPVTERIKTFEDAVFALRDHPFVTEWRMADNLSLDLEAYLQLRIICAALNEGWEPKLNRDEYRYSPLFCLYTKEEYEKLEEGKKDVSHVVIRSDNHALANGGVSYAILICDCTHVRANIGSQLVLKTKELAEYCGRQFIDIWADYLLSPNKRTKSN